MTIKIQFDGGCQPNPGQKYGSYRVMLDGKLVHQASRINFGFGTNNEAEFNSLIAALEWVNESMDVAGLPKNLYQVEILTDSTIVRNRVSGKNATHKKEAQIRMAELTGQCRLLLGGFAGYTIQWISRDFNVVAFGH